ncbi:MAG: hypothetical protein IT443_05420 [Phycisphaeraceae bacterium]|nr:hypothetical protein [Phycisphaeraceae bacterium]
MSDQSTRALSPSQVHRVEVWPKPGQPDPVGEAVRAEARQTFPSLTQVRSARVYLIEAELSGDLLRHIAEELLADPVNQEAVIGTRPGAGEGSLHPHPGLSLREGEEMKPGALPGGATVEVHYQPGVMDPVAQSTEAAIAEMMAGTSGGGGGGRSGESVSVRTGFRYDFFGAGLDGQALGRFAEKALANPVIQDIHLQPLTPGQFPHTKEYQAHLTHVAIRDLDDDGLAKLSRQGHLFLSLEEMRAVRDYFRASGREPTDIELETLAQTWSEHCVHKTLKSTIQYRQPQDQAGAGHTPGPGDWAGRPGHTLNEDGSITIDNLLKSTIAAATFRLMENDSFRDWCISVFKDNAGIVKFDDEDGVCIKVETHNHPSAIEPYGGAATGIGGCIRDVLGTGLAARPIANTDVFCVAMPDSGEPPKGVIHPKRILRQVVAGIRDYGNRKGIPTVNGAVWFDENYLGNPLVFAGCVGLIPLDKCFGKAEPGDRIIALGGATGRDGIHGATFSSAELTDSHADEFAHAVQIGNAITQKKVLDVILQARDPRKLDSENSQTTQGEDHAAGRPLFTAITDCGAGGFSSAVGEMGKDIGAKVTLETAPLKYAGLSYTEIWISEAQERMILAVPPGNVEKLRELCAAEDVAMCDLGQFGWQADGSAMSSPSNGSGAGDPMLVLTYRGLEVGQLSMHFLHEGLPSPTRQAQWTRKSPPVSPPLSPGRTPRRAAKDMGEALYALLGHPNIASKHWIIRQYDHEVQGGSVIKPLTGPGQDGPSDGAVLRPKLNSARGIALASGMAPNLSEIATTRGLASDGDSYWMALAAIDEAVRNLICLGADPRQIAILDNFCWPSCQDAEILGSLVRASEGCYDGALTYGVPFVSGKDSLNNQFTTEDGQVIAIPATLLITGLGIVPDVTKARSMDAKAAGNLLLLVGQTSSRMGGSHYVMTLDGPQIDRRIPRVDLSSAPRAGAAVAALIERGLLASAHDCADGGLLVAAVEMAFAGRLGLELALDQVPASSTLTETALAFSETPGRYLVEVEPAHLDAAVRLLRQAHVPFAQVGRFSDSGQVKVRSQRLGQLVDESIEALRQAWLKPLDW